jgi:Flp pilus assembly protein TadG
MTRRKWLPPAGMKGIFARLRHFANCLLRGQAGMAAVEFALIVPMMLALYFGCVVLAQGLEVSRKTQALSRTLADLTSQTPPSINSLNVVKTGTCLKGSLVNTYSATNWNSGIATNISKTSISVNSVPCITDLELQNILAASTAVLYPFSGSPNMTITQVVFDNVSSTNSQCCVAKVVWSVGAGPNPTLRQCGALAISANGVNSPTSIPTGLYPPAVSSSNNIDNFMIVADVSYTYVPSFGFAPFAWNKAPNGGAGYTISQTTYMAPRLNSTAQIFWKPDGTIPTTNYVACSPNLETASTSASIP